MKNHKATYKKIQEHVKKQSSFVPKSCWIADVKELCGLPVKRAHNRKGEKRENPCPEKKRPEIKEAFIRFGLLDKDGSPIK